MCTVCQALDPSSTNYDFHNLQNSTSGGTTLSASLPTYSYDQIADYLTEGFWNDLGTSGRSFNVQTGDTITFNVSGLTDYGAETAIKALDAWTAVSGLQFQAVSDPSRAQIVFDDNQSGAFASSATWSGTIFQSNVNISSSWAQYGDYYFQTYMHEIGHALGLGHTGNYNGGGNYGRDANYANDSWQTSVMSYFDQRENPNTDASFAYLATLQLGDIAAIHKLYGTPTNIRTGDTIYGEGHNTGQFGMDLSGKYAVAIVDSGGTDLINLASSSKNQNLSLVEETYSDINGKKGNFSIGRDTVIENATTGSGNDTIMGNAVNNQLNAGAGNDILFGGAGADRLTGGAGADKFVYSSLSDAGDRITDLNLAAGDNLDVLELLAELGYQGADPVADGIFALKASGSGSWFTVTLGATTTQLVFLEGVSANTDLNAILGIPSVAPADTGGSTDTGGSDTTTDTGGNTGTDGSDTTTDTSDSGTDDVSPTDGVLTFAAGDISGFGGKQDQGTASVSSDGTAITLADNAWKQVMEDVTITADTVLRFDFSSTQEGEVHGIGFEVDGELSENRIFQLDGLQKWGIQDYNKLYNSSSGETQSYTINVGDHFTGDFDRIVFVMDDDANIGADSTFSNIQIDGNTGTDGSDTTTDTSDSGTDDVSPTDGVLTFAAGDISGFGGKQDQGTASVSSDGTAITLADNAWKQVMEDVTITADTVLRFDFSSTQEGEVHGIGFEVDGELSENRIFQLDGLQKWGIQDYNKLYNSSSGETQSYTINVGDHFTGDFDRIVFVMDDDANIGADSTFSNIQIDGNTGTDGSDTTTDTSDSGTDDVSPTDGVLTFAAGDISGFGGKQDQGTASVSSDGTAITLADNAWKQVMEDVTITADTVLRFDFSSTQEGEVHGIGFEVDGELSENRIFQLDGLQKWGIQDYNKLYNSSSGETQSYTINVGDHFTGDFDRIVFVMDDDANIGADSTFEDVFLL